MPSLLRDDSESPFELEALELRRPRAANALAADPLAVLAGLARGLSRPARRHVERALVRQLLDHGVRDRRRLAAALAELRRGFSDAGSGALTHEVVEQELRSAGEPGYDAESAEPEAWEAREADPQDERAEGDFARDESGAVDEAEADELDQVEAVEECEDASDEAPGARDADELDDREADDETEGGEDESPFRDEMAEDGETEDESPFRDEAAAGGDAEDESPFRDEAAEDAERDAGADEAWETGDSAGALAEAEDPTGWEAVLEQAEVEDEAEDELDEEELDLEDEGGVEMEGEIPDAAEIARNLGAIQVSTRQVTLRQAPNPFDLNAVASRNSDEKREVFKALQKTWGTLAGVEKKLAAQPKPAVKAKLEAQRAKLVRTRDQQAAALKAWLITHALDHSRDLRATRANLKAKKQALAKIAGKRKHAAKADKLRADIQAIQTALPLIEDSLKKAAAAYEPLKDITQSHHRVSVPDGASGAALVSLHDHVVAFATDTRLGLEGSAGGDTRAGVQAALQAAPIGADKRAILGLLSEHEGTFSNVNTWDRAVITFGFIQWTTDAAGDGTLTGVMQAVRDAAPDAYRRCFQRFGLDIARSGGRRVFKLTLPDGRVLLAEQAAREMQTSVKHVAALSAAGLDPAVQAAELRVAVETKIDGMLAKSVAAGGQSARLRDLLTSEYGVAVMTDRATGTGEPGTRNAAQRGFAAYMKAHPGADMSRDADRQAAGARVLQSLEALDPGRAKDYARLSHQPGSFTP